MQKPRFTIAAVAALAMAGGTSATVHAQASHAPVAAFASSHAAARPAAAALAALDDPTIVAIYEAANTWDINMAHLALRKSHNAEVHRFADMMVRDHTAARQLGRDLAMKLQVTPTPPGKDFPLYKDYVATRAKLDKLSGAAFDKAYIDHEVWYHTAVIDAIKNTLLPATKNAELKDLEIKVAPNFEAHLAAAKVLQQKLGK